MKTEQHKTAFRARKVTGTFGPDNKNSNPNLKNKNAGPSQKTTAFCFVNCQFHHVICKSSVIISTFKKRAPDFIISMTWYSLHLNT